MAMNREVCLSILARAATACFNQWARDQQDMKMRIVTLIHTFGADLKWRPHLHLLVTEGGLSLDGECWVRPYNLGWLMSHAGLKKMWKYHVVRALREAHRNGKPRFPAKASFLKLYNRFSNFLASSGSSPGTPTLEPAYWIPGPRSATSAATPSAPCWPSTGLPHYDGKTVRFAFKDYAEGGKISSKTLPVLAFIGRLVRHMPDKHCEMVRYGGLVATRWRADNLARARRALGQDREEEDTLVPAATAASHVTRRERREAESGVEPLR